MKKIFALLVLFTIAACTVDDEDSVYVPPDLVGSWKEIYRQDTPESQIVDVSDCSQTQVSLQYTFEDNGVYMITSACDPSLTEPRSGNYTFIDNVLTLTEGDATYTYFLIPSENPSTIELQRQEEVNGVLTDLNLLALQRQN